MNKTLKIVLACSLAANVVFAFGIIGGFFSFPNPTPSQTSNANHAGKAAASSLSPESAKEIKALLAGAEPETLRDQLNALGLPQELARAIVNARIWNHYKERERAITHRRADELNRRPYWQQNKNTPEDLALRRAEQTELRELRRSADEEARRVLGSGDNIYAQMRMSYLPPEKIEHMGSIERDYSDLRSQTYEEMSGFRMPDDAEKLKLLDEEKQNDILALLSPEEREMHDLRNSQTAQRVQSQYNNVSLSEAEYKTIYSLQKSIDEKYDTSALSMMMAYGNSIDHSALSEIYRARSEAQKEVDSQIKEIIGPERWAGYELNQRSDYRSLQSAAQRFNLSNDSVAQTYQTRNDVAGEAKRISDDKNLNATQKNAAYAALAEQASNQIRATLGDDIGNAYINNSLSWLKNLPKGGTVHIDERGNVYVAAPRPQR